MEFDEQLAALARKVRDQRDLIETEEATKSAFIMPFMSTVLGYDVFNPLEVVPEFTADVGVKRGEKVDYAILHQGEVQILIECKKLCGTLKIEHASQLFRYFAVTSARIAILTNGIVYQFYTDLDAPNRMDAKPFLVLDLESIDETLIPELRKLRKDVFDLDSIISAAGELKYVGQIKRLLATQFREPEEEWVRFFTNRVYEGAFTAKVRAQFSQLVEKATKQFLNEQVNARLKTALGTSGVSSLPQPADTTETDDAQRDQDVVDADDGIVTTFEEIEGFHIVRAIACSDVQLDRIVQRDAKSYFAILLDDNNRKPIARLHFNRKQKYLGTFDEEKNETRHPIDTLDEIYQYADAIRQTIRQYEAVHAV